MSDDYSDIFGMGDLCQRFKDRRALGEVAGYSQAS